MANCMLIVEFASQDMINTLTAEMAEKQAQLQSTVDELTREEASVVRDEAAIQRQQTQLEAKTQQLKNIQAEVLSKTEQRTGMLETKQDK